jgi:hypothetical protein
MKKVLLFAVMTALFACQSSFASKNSEFTFGVDKILVSSKGYGNNGVAPKLEYCYYVSEQSDEVRAGIVLGVNKFLGSDFDPFNVYAIGKIVVPSILTINRDRA